MVYGIGDGFLPVTDLHKFSCRLSYACFNVFNDILRLFKPGIIRGDDRQVRISAADLPHFKAPQPGAVSPAAQKTYQPGRLILPQSGQQALKAHGVVGIIDHQGKRIRHRDHLDPSLYMGPQKRLLYLGGLHLEMPAHSNGGKGIVHAEPPGGWDLHLKIHAAPYPEVNAQLSWLMHQL